MKKNTLFLGLFLTCFTVITGFSNYNDPVYSCDPEIDAWVKKNKESFINISRDELVKHSNPDVQLAIYRSLTGKQKSFIWKEKIAIEANKDDLVEKDKNHIL